MSRASVDFDAGLTTSTRLAVGEIETPSVVPLSQTSVAWFPTTMSDRATSTFGVLAKAHEVGRTPHDA
jgi:hypothetical protein